jgi:hypothetical protein
MGAPKYALKGVVVKAAPVGASAEVANEAVPSRNRTVAVVVLGAVVCAAAIEPKRVPTDRTAELRNRGMGTLG